MIKKTLLLLLFVLVAQVTVSCSKDDNVIEDNPIVIIPEQENNIDNSDNDDDEDPNGNKEDEGGISDDDKINLIVVSHFANNGRNHQSAAAYGDYAFFVPDRRSALYCYNLKTKRVICTKIFEAVNERTSGDYILYHCNQMTFGPDFFDEKDPFPLLYISQRARDDRRCILEVYRLKPEWSESESEYSSLDAELVQMIYFPVESKYNALGRVNCVMDSSNRVMYTYSYSTISGDPDRTLCRLSSFAIPDKSQPEVVLNDDAILESHKYDYKATNSQGACIHNDRLFITQGYASFGIYLNVFDLKKKKLLTRVDLLANGITWEPEGCFVYNGNIMVSTGCNIWEFHFE